MALAPVARLHEGGGEGRRQFSPLALSSLDSRDTLCRGRRRYWWVWILLERGSDSGELRGFAGLAADGRGRWWPRQLQRDHQAGVCMGSLDRGELDFGVVAYVREG